MIRICTQSFSPEGETSAASPESSYCLQTCKIKNRNSYSESYVHQVVQGANITRHWETPGRGRFQGQESSPWWTAWPLTSGRLEACWQTILQRRRQISQNEQSGNVHQQNMGLTDSSDDCVLQRCLLGRSGFLLPSVVIVTCQLVVHALPELSQQGVKHFQHRGSCRMRHSITGTFSLQMFIRSSHKIC